MSRKLVCFFKSTWNSPSLAFVKFCFTFIVRFSLQLIFLLFIMEVLQCLFYKLLLNKQFVMELLNLSIILSSCGNSFWYSVNFYIQVLLVLLLVFTKVVGKSSICYLLYFIASIISFILVLQHYFFSLKHFLNSLSYYSDNISLDSDPSKPFYYISLLKLSPRTSRKLRYFSVNRNSVVVKCSNERAGELSDSFKALYVDSCLRAKRIYFFNYVFGNVIYKGILKNKKGISHFSLDRDYFLKHFNIYVLSVFSSNDCTDFGHYFCKDVRLCIKLDFWLSVLNEDGTFKDSFLSCYSSNSISVNRFSVNLFIHSFDVLHSGVVFYGFEKKLVYKDISIILKESLKDGEELEKFIHINTKFLCIEYRLDNWDFDLLGYSFRTGPGFEKFLKDNGSLF